MAVVTEEPRMVMYWQGQKIADLHRSFLNSNGAPKSAKAEVPSLPKAFNTRLQADGFIKTMRTLVQDLNVCSQRGLAERFDSTNGAGTVLMPFGGARQKTPEQIMAALFPVENGKTRACSAMAFGGDPYLLEQNPYQGAYLAVLESVLKLTAAGFSREVCIFPSRSILKSWAKNQKRWGKPVSPCLAR